MIITCKIIDRNITGHEFSVDLNLTPSKVVKLKPVKINNIDGIIDSGGHCEKN